LCRKTIILRSASTLKPAIQLLELVPGAGLEPAQSYDREILSLFTASTNSAFLELRSLLVINIDFKNWILDFGFWILDFGFKE